MSWVIAHAISAVKSETPQSRLRLRLQWRSAALVIARKLSLSACQT